MQTWKQALTNLQSTLQAAIDEKQAKGEYLVAADLKTLEDAVAKLQSGKADASTVETIQTTISNLGDTYATDAELTAAIDAVKLLIPTIPTKVSVFENDAGYITDAALTDYAKSADAEMVANKVSDATAEQIEAMSSTDKATKYPSIAVAQTIANAAVTKVNEVAGDLSSLQTQVSTNTADITKLDGKVKEVSVIANAAIPAPTEACKSASGACALSSDTEGNLTWVVIADNYLTKNEATNTYLTETQVTQQITNVVGTSENGVLADVAANKTAIAGLRSSKANTADVYSKTDADSTFATKTALAGVDAKFANYTKTSELNSTFATDAELKAVDDKFANYTTTEGLTTKLADYTKTSDLDSGFVSEAEMTEFKSVNTAAIDAKVAQSDYDTKVSALEAK